MTTFTDQLNRQGEINFPPKRIISLVPSQTELLFDLGLNEEVAGITKFCVHPQEWFNKKIRVGGTKKINFQKIAELKPDLIIGNKEENEKSQIEELAKKYPVWMSDVKNLEDALKMIASIGEIARKQEKALEITNEIRKQFQNLPHLSSVFRPPSSVLYFIWKKPIIAVGKNTFINNMIERCGFQNIIQGRYPEISADELRKQNPDYVFLSSEPYPFRKKHIAEFQSICPDSKIILVDGEMFSWYGSRLLKSPLYFSRLLESLQ